MATTESPVLLQSGGGSALRVLTKPWVDRVLAAVAIAPFVYSVAVNYHNAHADIPSVLWLVDMLIIISTVLFRKAPVRVTPNPWYWALAFVATYWGFLTWGIQIDGRPVAPVLIFNTIAILGTATELWGRFSLGAQHRICSGAARHCGARSLSFCSPSDLYRSVSRSARRLPGQLVATEFLDQWAHGVLVRDQEPRRRKLSQKRSCIRRLSPASPLALVPGRDLTQKVKDERSGYEDWNILARHTYCHVQRYFGQRKKTKPSPSKWTPGLRM